MIEIYRLAIKFVKGLIRDFDAIDLTVSSNLSNEFVEDINNRPP